MAATIEIIMPVRNPGDPFAGTLDSLLAQTDRDFSVLLSDNFSTKGERWFAEAKARLEAAGIACRVVRPPWELGRVQHWNWAHHQGQAAWWKPLFVGDKLEPDCLAACREVLAAEPEVRFLFFQFYMHREGATELADCGGASGRLRPEEVADRAIFGGNFLGGPLNVLYHRDAFQAQGGHLPSLPYLADFDLYARLAQQVPTYVLPRPLAHFVAHADRFSKKGSGVWRESMSAEFALETALLGYSAFTAGRPVPLRRLVPQLLSHAGSALKEWVFRFGGRVRRGEW